MTILMDPPKLIMSSRRLINCDDLIKQLLLYDTNANIQLVYKAYSLLESSCNNYSQKLGLDYFNHLLAVAQTLISMRLDHKLIILGLLQNILEISAIKPEELSVFFGEEIAGLISIINKISNIDTYIQECGRPENFRILLVKIADRLNIIKDLHNIYDEEKRQKIALETLEIYVPICESIGIHQIRDELEDLSFRHLHPEYYEDIKAKVESSYNASKKIMMKITTALIDLLHYANIENCTVYGRRKSFYSIWRKMKVKNIGFDQLSDVIGFRILLGQPADCYRALGVIHENFSVLSKFFKDYISNPKQNNYQSIHTVIVGPFNQRTEIQIRTYGMHKICEFGVAAHWIYKLDKQQNPLDFNKYNFMRKVLDGFTKSDNLEKFLGYTKVENFKEEVFCFTPKGKLIVLPKHAVAIDFAYAINSKIGDDAISAIINGQSVSLLTSLRNGDQVYIVTNNKNSTPLDVFVANGNEKIKIDSTFKKLGGEQSFVVGKNLLSKNLMKKGIVFNEETLEEHLAILHINNIKDFYMSITQGKLGLRIATEFYINSIGSIIKSHNFTHSQNLYSSANQDTNPNAKLQYANCCHPLPGDLIVSVPSGNNEIIVHMKNCPILKQFYDPRYTTDLLWQHQEDNIVFISRIKVFFLNLPGSLAQTTNRISKQNCNIVNIQVTSRTAKLWELFFDLEVKDLPHLQQIIAALRSLKIISLVERV